MAAAIFVLWGRSVESILFVVGARESRAICLRRRLGFVLGEQNLNLDCRCVLYRQNLYSPFERRLPLNDAVTSLIQDTLVQYSVVHDSDCFLR